ncbi:MAG: VacJ family lipoprotein, partial [Sphingomonadales bacterium]|nr:VacJ family lipoprotein [Sphingomonadales bacterium]
MLGAYLALQMAVTLPAPADPATPTPAAAPAEAVAAPTAPAIVVPTPVAPAAAPAPTTPALDDVVPRVPGETDPLQPINRVFYAINRPIDRFVFRPAAMAYKAVLPKPVRDGARNFLQLIDEP